MNGPDCSFPEHGRIRPTRSVGGGTTVYALPPGLITGGVKKNRFSRYWLLHIAIKYGIFGCEIAVWLLILGDWSLLPAPEACTAASLRGSA
jgi:hypothetical protein